MPIRPSTDIAPALRPAAATAVAPAAKPAAPKPAGAVAAEFTPARSTAVQAKLNEIRALMVGHTDRKEDARVMNRGPGLVAWNGTVRDESRRVSIETHFEETLTSFVKTRHNKTASVFGPCGLRSIERQFRFELVHYKAIRPTRHSRAR